MEAIIKQSNIHGLGVFTTGCILKNDIIEVCQIIKLDEKDTKIIDKTNLYNYYFSWEENGSAICLGNGSLYNHSYEPNAVYIKDYKTNTITFIAIKFIGSFEEITVNYNGNPNIKEKVWFDK